MNTFRLTLTFCVTFVFFSVFPARAASVPDLYTAEVPYDSARRNARALAYDRALKVVMARITPEIAVVDIPTVLGKTSDYVSGWRESGNNKLWVAFDGMAITARLRDAGIPVWGSDRPLTLVWLALDRGRAGRTLVAAQPPAETGTGQPPTEPLVLAPVQDPADRLREALGASSSRYGVPLAFPRLDAQDTDAVTPSDVWGGFDDVVLEASQRYGTSSVLLGRASAANTANIRWVWLFAGERREFTGSLDIAARRVAAAQMQVLASNPAASNRVRVLVAGLQGASGLAKLARFLSTRSLIERADIVAMRGDSVVYEIDSLTTRDRLLTILESAGLASVRNGFDPAGVPQLMPGNGDPFNDVDFRLEVVRDGALR